MPADVVDLEERSDERAWEELELLRAETARLAERLDRYEAELAEEKRPPLTLVERLEQAPPVIQHLDALLADESRRLRVPADDALVLQGLLPPREGETIEDVRARVARREEGS